MAAPNPLEAFIWGSGGQRKTQDQIAREREIAAALAEAGMDYSPVQHWTQGAARAAQGLAGGLKERWADEADASNRGAWGESWGNVFGGGASADPVAAALAGDSPALSAIDGASPSSGGGMDAYRNAIASIESAGSGDYGAIGPIHPELGRALGRYQVMEANIGPWSQQVLGREVSPDEFMANPELQDAIFDGIFGGYVNEYGPEGAAQAWFSGPGGVGQMGRRDVLGTTNSAYTDKFTAALGGGTPDASAYVPAQVASLDPSMNAVMTPEMHAGFAAANPDDLMRTGPNTATAPADPSAMMRTLPNVPQSGIDILGGITGGDLPNLSPVATRDDAQALGIPEFSGLQPPPGPGTGEIVSWQAPDGSTRTAEMTETPGISRAITAQAPSYDMAQLLGLMGDPNAEYASPAQQQIMQALLGQQMDQQDPRNQIEMLILQEELNALQNPTPAAPEYEIVDGEVVWLNPSQQTATSGGQFGQPDTTSAMQNYEYLIGQGTDPQMAMDRAFTGGVTVNNIPAADAGTNSFFRGLADAERGNYETMLTNGQNAGRTLAQLDQLEGLLANTPQGFEAAATAAAGNFGIDLGNATGVQAAEALINQMVPAQRPPGSGPMSDADLELFKRSVPRLINQPGGNEMIIQTMRDINTYDRALADLIQEYTWRGEMAQTDEEAIAIRREMRGAISELQNPMENFNDRISGYRRDDAPTGGAGQSQANPDILPAPEGVSSDLWSVMTPEERALWQ